MPQYQATLPEGDILNFCSSPCVAKFQVGLFFFFYICSHNTCSEDIVALMWIHKRLLNQINGY